MRLVTYRRRGVSRAGILRSDTEIVDPNRALAARLREDGSASPQLSADGLVPSSMIDLLAFGASALEVAAETLGWLDSGSELDRDAAVSAGIIVPVADCTLEAPIPRPGKVLAIGVNYGAHAAEMARDLPEYPTVFTKVSSCIVGTGHPVHVPKESHMIDWEGELCVVIGRRARHIPADRAFEVVAGYMNGNDVTVRDWQRHTATWMMGKSWDTHGPTGPWILTADEVPDPAQLTLRTYVNDVEKQHASVDDLLIKIPRLIEYLSTAFTLEPGDVIFTGTPSGVGQARDPQEWLQPGDTVRVEITGLGALENPVIAEPGR